MRAHISIFGVFTLAALTPLASFAQSSTGLTQQDTPVSTPQEQAANTRAEQRGTLIYNYDQAAWYSTDALMEDLKDPDSLGLQGWVITPNGSNLDVTYFGALDSQGRRPAIYIATMNGQKVVSKRIPKKGKPEYLSPTQLAMAAAIYTVRTQKMSTCGKAPPNSVTLPPEPNGNVDIYILSPQTQDGIYPVGGHSLFTFAQDGKLVSSRTFTKSCIPLSDKTPGQKNIVALGVGHLMDPTPTEIHVWLSLWTGKPILVTTDQGKTVWLVDKGKITLVTRKGMDDQEALKRVLG